MNPVLASVNKKSKINEESYSLIQSSFQARQLKKGEYLLREGLVCSQLYFIESGIARSFYYHNEKEVTSWLYNEGQWISSWYSFYSQQQSFEYIQILENADLFSISFSSYQKLLKEIPEFNTFGRLLAEEQTAFIDYFSKGFSYMSAKEKYNLILDLFPDISQRVNLGYIASFLGITQETLSRIRKR